LKKKIEELQSENIILKAENKQLLIENQKLHDLLMDISKTRFDEPVGLEAFEASKWQRLFMDFQGQEDVEGLNLENLSQLLELLECYDCPIPRQVLLDTESGSPLISIIWSFGNVILIPMEAEMVAYLSFWEPKETFSDLSFEDIVNKIKHH